MENSKEIALKLLTAIENDDLKQVKEYIKSNKQLLYFETPFGSWLHVAASHGKLDIVKYLLESGLDINTKGGIFEGAAINEAASEGQKEIVKYLIDCGAELDVSEPVCNPLFSAIQSGNTDIVKLLIDKGIDVHVSYTGDSMKNMDAYKFAIERGQQEIAMLLKDL